MNASSHNCLRSINYKQKVFEYTYYTHRWLLAMKLGNLAWCIKNSSRLKIFGLCSNILYVWPYREFVQYKPMIWCLMYASTLSRRHVFYLCHHWRREYQHYSSNGGSELVHLNDSDPGLQTVGALNCAGRGESVNGQGHATEAMEVDGASFPELHDSKRLKTGIMLPDPPTLSSEYSFASSILDDCCNPEQRRYALAYEKWLDTVIGHQPWKRTDSSILSQY